MIILFAVILICIFTFVIIQTVDAEHSRDQRCSVRATVQTYPVYFDGSMRTNPDGSAYPGDAFHFIFKLTGSKGCIRFEPQELVSKGAISVYSHAGGHEHHVPTLIHFNRDDKLEGGQRYGWNLLYAPASHGHSSVAKVYGHPWEDTSSVEKFNGILKNVCASLKGNQACVYGHAEISTSADKEKCLIEEMKKKRIHVNYNLIQDRCITIEDTLKQSVKGTGIKCNDKGCSRYTVTSSASSGITIRDPTPDVSFENPPILDLDLYDSKNKDGTYYVWDAPAVKIVPDKIFRDIRNDTITFEVQRQSNPLTEIFAESCHDERCVITASSANITDSTVNGINGDRLEVFMPASLNKLGIHNFTYNVKMLNINRTISDTNHDTSLFIVDYTPKYSKNVFSYILLKTDGVISLEKKWGTAIQYHGSAGTGPDDEGIIHENRRSKINDSIHTVLGVDVTNDAGFIRDFLSDYNTDESFEDDPFGQKLIDTTYHLIGGDDITDIVKSVEPSILESSGKDSLGEYETAMLSNKDTSLFTNAGFGRIKYAESGLNPYIENSTLSEIVIHSTVQSVNFGGYEETVILSYDYDYPSAYLATTLNITGIHSDGTRNDAVDIDARFEVQEINGTKYLSQYMASHIRNLPDLDQEDTDTQHKRNFSNTDHSEKFVDMYLGDMHDIVNELNGTGSVTRQINLPAVLIIPGLWDSLDIEDIDDADFTRYGEKYGLNAPGMYYLSVQSNGKENTIPYRTFDFSRGINYTINIDDDNYLNHTRYLSTVHIDAPDVFGVIEHVKVNYGDPIWSCPDQCYVTVRENSTIVAENIWGGTATLDVIKQVLNGTGEQSELVAAYIDNTAGIVLFIVMIAAIILIYSKYLK